jgi:uncharacterized membrane protein
VAGEIVGERKKAFSERSRKMKTGLAIFGLVFGLLVLLDGIFEFGLIQIVRPASKTEIKVSEIIIGLLLIVLAILTLVGVF